MTSHFPAFPPLNLDQNHRNQPSPLHLLSNAQNLDEEQKKIIKDSIELTRENQLKLVQLNSENQNLKAQVDQGVILKRSLDDALTSQRGILLQFKESSERVRKLEDELAEEREKNDFNVFKRFNLGEMEDLKRKLKQKETELMMSKGSIENLSKIMKEIKEQALSNIREREQKKAEVDAQLEEMKMERERMEEERKEKENIRIRCNDLETRVQKMSEEIANLTKMKNQLESNAKSNNQKLSDVQKQLKQKDDSITTLQKELKQSKSEAQNAKDLNVSLQNTQQQLDKERQKNAKNLSNKDKEIEQLKKTLAESEELVQKFREGSGKLPMKYLILMGLLSLLVMSLAIVLANKEK